MLSYAQPVYRGKPQYVADARRASWVDSIYESLSLDERIGQLIMVQANSGGRNYNEDKVTKLIADHQVGGLIFSVGGPVRQALLTNKYQQIASVPLLIAMDAEWGLGMRLDSVKPFPRQMMMGATRDTGLMATMGAAIAAQCHRMGIHINFAPDVDINNNPENPVINSRSFGESKVWVARMGRAYTSGLQRNGIIACAKHFPGHGNTSVDSHKDLPVITTSLEGLDSLELYAFRQLIAERVKSIMVAHLEVPALEDEPHVPTSLSKKTITGLLKEQLKYKGLVISDALNMQGVTKYFSGGEAEKRAFLAGADILLMPEDVPAAIAKIRSALENGEADEMTLAAKVKKVLAAKYDAGLARPQQVNTFHLTEDLNRSTDPIRAAIARKAVTIVKDENRILKKMNEAMRIGYIGINASGTTPLYEALNDQFDNVTPGWLPKGTPADSAQKLLESLAKYSLVVVAIHNTAFTPGGNYGLGDEAISFLQQAGCMRNVMVVLMGNAYIQQYFCGAGSVLVAYEDDTLTEQAVARVLLKKERARGILPVTSCAEGKSVCPAPLQLKVTLRPPASTLHHVFPADAGVVDMQSLTRLDQFMARCLAEGVYPGCRVLAARNGNVFYDRCFGYLDYEKNHKVDTNTLYDVASCTKVLATTIAVMKLYEEGRLDINKTIGDYLPASRGTNKEDLKIRDLLLHQAGLKGWIPFYKDILEKDGSIRADLCRTTSQRGYHTQVACNVFLKDDYIDTMWANIYDSHLDNKGRMVYSDLDFFFLAAIVQQITAKTIDKYVEETFYRPMGLRKIMYNPRKKMDSTDIAPTEIEHSFRHSTICGYVHDPGAAMLGGVAGHAGIFATAHDVAAIFQMLLNKGSYGGKRYLAQSTVDMFTAYSSKISRRALGFDKPLPEPDDGGPAGDHCSALAFGHQGFTGTCVWADPASGLLFVFLSNRVHPSSSNHKIVKLGVRTTAQDYIYESLGIPVNKARDEVYKIQVHNLR